MNLEIIYTYAKVYKTFKEFKAAINSRMTGGMTTAESDNEYELVLKNSDAPASSRENFNTKYYDSRKRKGRGVN